jgi:DNA gyrase subunit A
VEYSRPRNGGILACGINEGDTLLEAKLTNGGNEIVIATRQGKAIRFNESKVRSMGRTASGVRAVTLNEEKGDYVVGMICVEPASETETIFVVSENGYGKRSGLDEYNVTNRGGKGVRTINITEKTGLLVGIKVVNEDDDLMITNRSGIVIRTPISGVRVMGRAAQGVRCIRIDDGDSISDVAIVARDNSEDAEIEAEMTNIEQAFEETTPSTEPRLNIMNSSDESEAGNVVDSNDDDATEA